MTETLNASLGFLAQWRREALGRELTAGEIAADNEADAVRERKAAQHALWRSRLSSKERLRLGMA